MEAKKSAEGEGHGALAAGIDVLPIDLHFRATVDVPSIIEATSDDNGDSNCQWMRSDFRSTSR
jgi:hypothetical protein